MKNDKYSDALSGLSTAPVGSPLRNIRDLNTDVGELNRQSAATNQAAQIYPTSGMKFVVEGIPTPSTVKSLTIQALCIHSIFNTNSTNNLGDKMTFYLHALGGEYTMYFYSVTATAGGIFGVYVNDVLQDSIDMYSGSTTYNVISTVTLNLSDGNNTLDFICTGTSGANYKFFMQFFYWVPA